ncbi:D-glycerate dehydrogenase [Pullulanibacillus sp. KACC 23026]|uniref:2-hydroxyacid dehydrogenase n=1 Tax=Pullulanibacillus sp. KACC 23026 TaxID=3028315 RepID=UPI0023AEB587|nr:D-glycerate dehydrogenase [Pullulanibacillus sp. KACC 23026]WEG11830.1 D-glycerate dehydrogenase [Pullulanibacillus sp. KACC 23026]
MAKVVLTKELPEELLEVLKGEGEHEVVVVPDTGESFSADLNRELKDATALISTKVKINKDLLEEAPDLRIVSTISVGYDNFDVEAMKQAQVIGTHTPGVLDETVADLTFGLILSSARRIAELDQVIREGGWTVGDDLAFYGTDVHHKTLGIIGMGRIGEKIAKRAIFGFGMNVLYYNRSQKPETEERLGVHYASFDEVLSQSDFVVVVTPLTDETYHLFDRAAFQKMKSTAYFINVSRGQTVDEDALLQALESGEISGAALDVYDKEPVRPDHPLLRLRNVTLTPHIGSAVVQTRFDMAALAVQNVKAFLEKGTPPSVIPELACLLQ